MINYLGIHQSFDYTQAHLGLLAVLHIISCCLCTHLAVYVFSYLLPVISAQLFSVI